MKKLLIILALLISSCASLDAHTTKFQPLRQHNNQQVYLFSTTANFRYPLESENAEASRMAWLKQRLREHGLNDKNYTILNKKIVPADGGLIGDEAYYLHYEVLTTDQ